MDLEFQEGFSCKYPVYIGNLLRGIAFEVVTLTSCMFRSAMLLLLKRFMEVLLRNYPQRCCHFLPGVLMSWNFCHFKVHRYCLKTVEVIGRKIRWLSEVFQSNSKISLLQYARQCAVNWAIVASVVVCTASIISFIFLRNNSSWLVGWPCEMNSGWPVPIISKMMTSIFICNS